MSSSRLKTVCVHDAIEGDSHSIEMVGNFLTRGNQCADQFQYGEAIENFSKALAIAPGNEATTAAYNRVIQEIVPRWHFSMLNDRHRNDSYASAIERAVDESKTVLDIGTGSGLLAMMAARAGAKLTYTCEMNRVIAEIAAQIVSANGYADKIKVIAKKSDDLAVGKDLASKVDILITETLDSGLVGEGMIPIIIDAKRRLLKEGGQIIPRGATVYAALLESNTIWQFNNVTTADGFDVSLFNRLSTQGFFPVRLERFEHRFLTPPVEVCRFDFMADHLETRQFNIPVPAAQTGTCHAVAFWFDLDLDEQSKFSNSPDNLNSHWKQAVQSFDRPVPVRIHQELTISVTQELSNFQFALMG
jgi:type II protein arginine methyltransferase